MNNGRMMWAWLIAQSSNLDKNGETLLSSLPSLAGLFIHTTYIVNIPDIICHYPFTSYW